jgi:hypothetical protein
MIKKLSSVFYSSLVPQDIFEQILSHFSGPSLSDAFDKLVAILDYTVILEIARSAPTKFVTSFLQKAELEYNNSQLLDFLSVGNIESVANPDIVDRIRQVIERQLLALHSGLSEPNL